MRIVGFCGRAGAGKTYAARYLAGHPKARLMSFAAQLRIELETVLGIPPTTSTLWDKPSTPEVRWLLQQYGTEYRRAQDPDYWVDKGMMMAMEHHATGGMPVFDDVRFPNEADAIKAEGGLIVKVLTSDWLRKDRLGELPPEHASETSLDDYPADFILLGHPGRQFEDCMNKIRVKATFEDVDFMEAINESLTNRE